MTEAGACEIIHRMAPIRILPFILFTLFVVPTAFADEITHPIGNAVYAVRAARIRHADTKSPEHYRSAVELLWKAQMKFKHENEKEALTLAAEAEKEAQLALEESMNK